METRYLKYFMDVADTLSFTKAAQMNHVVQTTMSQNISALENQLGFKLFERNNRNVSLTKMGEMFYKEAETLLNAVDVAEHHIQQMKNGREGLIKIGYIGEQCLRFMPELLREFVHRFQRAGIELIQETPAKLDSLLQDGTCDLIFTVASEKNLEEYEEFVCDEQKICAVVSVRHPYAEKELVNYSDFANEKLVFFYPSCGFQVYSDMIHNCSRGGFTPNIVGFASDSRSLLLLIEAGQGISFLPESCNMGHKGAVRFINVNDDKKVVIVARWRKNHTDPVLNNFLDLTRNRMSKKS